LEIAIGQNPQNLQQFGNFRKCVKTTRVLFQNAPQDGV
jgi:hypothetical protein